MSHSTMNPTRQQLDELDAMLQRMLTLPTNPQESVAPPPPPPAPPPAPMMPPRTIPTIAAAPPVPVRPASPAPQPLVRTAPVTPGDHSWNVPLPSASGPAVSVFGSWPPGIEALSQGRVAPPPAANGNLRVTTVPSPDDQNRTREMTPPMQRLRIETPPNSAPMPAPVATPAQPTVSSPPVPFFLWPIAAFDWVLGNLLGQFGPPGRWLGQGSGKLFIGWCGVLMIGVAVAWGVMDYMGWRW